MVASRPSEQPASVGSKPSDTLLRNFRATLEARWSEFDRATLLEAEGQTIMGIGARAGRDADAGFIKAKLTFDQAKSMLDGITSDEELKANTGVLKSVEDTLGSISKYLADEVRPEERNKSHNIILAKTKADLADFRAKITGKPEDAREAVVALEAERSIVRPAVVTGVATSSIPFISSAEAAEVKDEVVGELKKTIGPWGMIFKGVRGLPTKDVAAQFKDIVKEWKETTWSDPFGKIVAGLKFFLLKGQINRSGIDLSKDMTPEEMRLAGLTVSTTSPSGTGEKPREGNEGMKDLKYIASVDMLLRFGQNRDERSQNILGGASLLLKEPSFQTITLAGLRKGYNVDKKELALTSLSAADQKIIQNIPGSADQKQKSLNLIGRLFFDKSNSIQSEVSRSLLAGGEVQTIRASILGASSNLRKFTPFGNIDLSNPQAMIQEGAGRYIPSINPDSGELSGELAEDFTKSMGENNALWIFGAARPFPVPRNTEEIDEHFRLNNTALSKDPEDVQKLRNILQFGVNIRELIKKDNGINLGNGDQISADLSQTFTLSELGVLYTFLDGKSDVSKMSGIEKGFLMMQIASMLSVGNKDSFGKYSTAIAGVFLGTPTNIPEDVKKVFSDILGYALDKTGNVIEDTGKVLWGAAKQNPKMAILMLAGILFGPWFTKRTSIIGSFK